MYPLQPCPQVHRPTPNFCNVEKLGTVLGQGKMLSYTNVRAQELLSMSIISAIVLEMRLYNRPFLLIVSET